EPAEHRRNRQIQWRATFIGSQDVSYVGHIDLTFGSHASRQDDEHVLFISGFSIGQAKGQVIAAKHHHAPDSARAISCSLFTEDARIRKETVPINGDRHARMVRTVTQPFQEDVY